MKRVDRMVNHLRMDGMRWMRWMAMMAVLVGCHRAPRVHYLREGETRHYRGVATDIAYADLDTPPEPSEPSLPPHTLTAPRAEKIWDITLEEAVRTALQKSQVIRNLGGSVLFNPEGTPTIYDPAIRESDPRFGVEGALAAFDTNLLAGITWSRSDRPVNNAVSVGNFFRSSDVFIFQEDSANFRIEANRTTPGGATLAIRERIDYSLNNASSNVFPSAYTGNVEFEIRQALLQGRGAEYGRIVGPNGQPGVYAGVVLARINTDIAIADFEQAVITLVSQVEDTYWQLYFAYRDLGAQIVARDAALESWREAKTKVEAGLEYRGAPEQAEVQYGRLQTLVEATLAGSGTFLTQSSARGGLYGIEADLRRLMGLPVNDGKLLRPADEPAVAPLAPDWEQSLREAMSLRVELRQQQWRIKQRELELKAAKYFLLPQLDLLAQYRQNSLGDEVFGDNDNQRFQNYSETLTDGHYADWTLGLQLTMPIGLRRAHAGVRQAQLQLARARKVLQTQELEVSHALGGVLRNLDGAQQRSSSSYSSWRAAIEFRRTTANAYYSGASRDVKLDNVLRAQEAARQAEVTYYLSVVDYTVALKDFQREKGTLLAYNNVRLAEGPWPERAYEDAYQRARERSNARILNVGHALPRPFVRETGLEETDAPLLPVDESASPLETDPLTVPDGPDGPALDVQPLQEPSPLQPPERPTPLVVPGPVAQRKGSAAPVSGWKSSSPITPAAGK